MDRALDLNKAIMLAIIWWIIMFFAVWAILPWYNEYTAVKVITAIFAGFLAFLLSAYTPLFTGYPDALTFGIIFVAVGIILDMAVTQRFNPDIFSLWSLWLGYVLVFLAPVFRIARKNV